MMWMYFLSQLENINLFGFPYLVLMNKFELVIPWWLGTEHTVRVHVPQYQASTQKHRLRCLT